MDYPNHLIKSGSKDSGAVKAIKTRLNVLIGAGLDEFNPNFGDSTEIAVKKFQKANQLLSDGVVGELTWERLFNVSVIVKPSSKVLRLLAAQIADGFLFVRELTGHNDGREVQQFLKNVGLPKGYAWCQAFLYSMFMMGAEQLKVKNPVPRTAGVLDCWEKAKAYRVVHPEEGDQFIMDFGEGAGHTGIVNEVKNGRIYTVEGNTSADPSYQGEDREGNGVFERNRQISSIKGFLRYV